ncbi:MAG: InlB B-repeat-containing protein, partial [Spirochaetaceae bacterium]|nr:InlB B-repeat-containing protein [Spirochaetaceae bacterium]
MAIWRLSNRNKNLIKLPPPPPPIGILGYKNLRGFGQSAPSLKNLFASSKNGGVPHFGARVIPVLFILILAGCTPPADPRPPVPEVLTVTFDSNGGDTQAEPRTKTITPPATTIDTLPAQPARQGYSFVEWNTRADGTGTSFTASTTVIGDLTVYAQWYLIPPAGTVYIVTFNSNGGDTQANPQTKTVTAPATTINTLPDQPSRQGHSFT